MAADIPINLLYFGDNLTWLRERRIQRVQAWHTIPPPPERMSEARTTISARASGHNPPRRILSPRNILDPTVREARS